MATHAARTGSIPVKDFSSAEEMLAHYKRLHAKTYAPRPKPVLTVVAPEPEPVAEAKPTVRAPTAEELLTYFREVYTLESPENTAERKVNAKRDARRICAAVAKMHAVTLEDIFGDSRRAHIVIARRKAMVLVAQNFPGWSLPMIGRFFGRDHTTILHALQVSGVRR